MTGDIVWINGPYEPGMWNDLMIFQNALQSELGENERVEADDGYVGAHPEYVKCPAGIGNLEETERMQQRLRNRQETINERFKNFECLNVVWRHEIIFHGRAFTAVAIILQLTINNGEKLFAVRYRDPPYENTGEDGNGDNGTQQGAAASEDENGDVDMNDL